MQKIIFVVLALTISCTLSAPSYCGFFKSFGQAFAGENCSSDLDTGCNAAVDGFAQMQKIIAGDTTALTFLIADAMRAYSSATSSMNTCEFMARFDNLLNNVFKIYIILMQHFAELRTDAMCSIHSFSTNEYAKLGECLGDALKILTTKA